MFLSMIRPKAETDVWIFLWHLSNKLLSSFTGSHTSNRTKRALLTKLHWTTLGVLPQIVDTILRFLPDESKPLGEVRSPFESGDWSSTAAGSRMKAVSSLIGQPLADAAATCFCLNTSFTKARLLCICTSLAEDMVKAIHKRSLDRSRTFHLMDFDQSFFTAREGVICAVENMGGRVQRAEGLNQLSTDTMVILIGVILLKYTTKLHLIY